MPGQNRSANFDLAKLTPVAINTDARSYWETEAGHLTPWVIDNLDLIGRVVGLTLDPATVRREVPLGQFRADIVLCDQSGRKVVIENQFGPSDHDHFAKIVLYACEASADVVIWIVAGAGGRFYRSTPIRQEHQRTLARLNARFADDVAFYGVSIELESEPMERPGVEYPCLPRVRLTVAPSQSL